MHDAATCSHGEGERSHVCTHNHVTGRHVQGAQRPTFRLHTRTHTPRQTLILLTGNSEIGNNLLFVSKHPDTALEEHGCF